jgi:hypothetical protein
VVFTRFECSFFNMSRRSDAMSDGPYDNSPVATEPEIVLVKECIICMDKTAESAFVPCGHASFCEVCAKRAFILKKQCPVCRRRAGLVLKLIYS